MSDTQAKIATIRHNRARGKEDKKLLSELFAGLSEVGAFDWVSDSLMMDKGEWDSILSQSSRAFEDINAIDVEVTQSGVETDYTEESDNQYQYPNGDNNTGSTDRQLIESDVSASENVERDKHARHRFSELEQPDESTNQIYEGKTYHSNVLFTGDQAELVSSILGDNPNQKIIEFCVMDKKFKKEKGKTS